MAGKRCLGKKEAAPKGGFLIFVVWANGLEEDDPTKLEQVVIVEALRAPLKGVQILDIQFRHTHVLPASVNMHRSGVDF
ncbi:MAG: hypothetical protein WBQ77_00865, partial [Methyloceanibacter sp.]